MIPKRRLLSIENLAHFQDAFREDFVFLTEFAKRTLKVALLNKSEPVASVDAGAALYACIHVYDTAVVGLHRHLTEIGGEGRLHRDNQTVAVLLRREGCAVFEDDSGFHFNSFPKSSIYRLFMCLIWSFDMILEKSPIHDRAACSISG